MPLKGKKPAAIEKRLKCLFYGAEGVGKTTAGISFPRPYLIDCERGAENSQYIKLLEDNGGAILQTADFDELIVEIKTLLTEPHEYKTLIIDPLTIMYNDLVDKAALRFGTEFGKNYAEANKHIKYLLSLLTKLDMNIIITSHSKNEYAGNMVIIGNTFDCYKKLGYLFDLVLEITERGKERHAIVKKTRIETFPKGDSFKFSYDEVAQRYGREILERDAIAVELATPEQVEEFTMLLDDCEIEKETLDKWLAKCDAHAIEDMPKSYIQKAINHLNQEKNKRGFI